MVTSPGRTPGPQYGRVGPRFGILGSGSWSASRAAWSRARAALMPPAPFTAASTTSPTSFSHLKENRFLTSSYQPKRSLMDIFLSKVSQTDHSAVHIHRVPTWSSLQLAGDLRTVRLPVHRQHFVLFEIVFKFMIRRRGEKKH